MKEKINAYKQQQEAKAFFNQYNNYHLTTKEAILCFLAAFTAATLASFLFHIIQLQLKMMLSISYLVIAYFSAAALKYIKDATSKKTAIIATLGYILGCILGCTLYSLFVYKGMGLGIAYHISMSILWVTGDIFSLIFFTIGALFTYQLSK